MSLVKNKHKINKYDIKGNKVRGYSQLFIQNAECKIKKIKDVNTVSMPCIGTEPHLGLLLGLQTDAEVNNYKAMGKLHYRK